VNKIDHALGHVALDWLQWGDEWDEECAQIALTYMSQLKAAVKSQEAELERLREIAAKYEGLRK
jgi:hypothetical protein